MPHGVDNAFGEFLGDPDVLARAFERVDVEERQHRAIDRVVHGAIGMNFQRIPMPVSVLQLAPADYASVHGAHDRNRCETVTWRPAAQSHGIVSEWLKLTGQICLLLSFQRSALESNSLAG